MAYYDTYTAMARYPRMERSSGMFPIVKKRVLNETVTLMEIQAPLVARKAQPDSSLSSALMRKASVFR